MVKEKKNTRRTKLAELPKGKKQLSKDEQRKVKGGATYTPGLAGTDATTDTSKPRQ